MEKQKLAVKVGNLYYSGFAHEEVKSVNVFNMTCYSIESTFFVDKKLAEKYAEFMGGKVVKIKAIEED